MLESYFTINRFNFIFHVQICLMISSFCNCNTKLPPPPAHIFQFDPHSFVCLLFWQAIEGDGLILKTVITHSPHYSTTASLLGSNFLFNTLSFQTLNLGSFHYWNSN
jgi:hypothetical protein